MSREEVYGALGWIGRKGKIIVERRGREMIFLLREAEARLEASEGNQQSKILILKRNQSLGKAGLQRRAKGLVRYSSL
jgi:hypothetical protein